MARTIEEIESGMITAVTADPILSGLTSTSAVAVWLLMIKVFARCVWLLEGIFGLHKQETINLINQLKPHRPTWYKNKSLAFQYGHDLIFDSDVYNNTGFTDEQIAESRIIKYSAVREPKNESRVIILIATESDETRTPISEIQLDAFQAYIEEIKDAGVDITIVNFLPDRFYPAIDIYYDPLVLDPQGNSILNGGRPVEAAIKEYLLQDLPFNGELVLAHLVDKLQKVDGVAIPNLLHAETSWIDADTDDYGDFQAINVKKIPVSGYFELVDFSGINYIPNV